MKQESLHSRSKSTNLLSRLKEHTKQHTKQHPPFLEPSPARKLHSRGKLSRGPLSKPLLVLTREERLNPWRQKYQVEEQIITRKGIMALSEMGIISKNANCMELLNAIYDSTPVVMPALPASQTFLTHLNTFEEPPSEKVEEVQLQFKRQKSAPKSGKVRVTVRAANLATVAPPLRLKLVNYQVEQSEAYLLHRQKMLLTGTLVDFDFFVNKMSLFATKYELKKISFTPSLNPTRRLTDSLLLASIQNHQILGIDFKVKSDGRQQLRRLVKRKIALLRFGKIKILIAKIDKLKKIYKINKIYREMAPKRWQYVHFKLASFAESQRRFSEIDSKPQVQIHLFLDNLTRIEASTYYKYQERARIQLTRIFADDVEDIILLVSSAAAIQTWIDTAANLKSHYKVPTVHVIQFKCVFPQVRACEEVYYGMDQACLNKVKSICRGKRAVLYPSAGCSVLPKICESLNVHLSSGNFTPQSLLLLADEHKESSCDSRDFRAQKNYSQKVVSRISSIVKQIQLASQLNNSKTRAKHIFQSAKVSNPISVSTEGKKEEEFFMEMTKIILGHKNINTWVFKLPRERFSRGLAYFQTETLKIIKEHKRKATLTEQELRHLASLMHSILIQKMMIPHNNLLTSDQFFNRLMEEGGYMEAVHENTTSPCVFVEIKPNGKFIFLGSYRKYYAEGICFGACYPASEITASLVATIKKLCSLLYAQNLFGFVTFELLYQEDTRQFHFIDLQPQLEPYSSFYYYYRRLLDIRDHPSGNNLPRAIFYCPFIDNNGTKCDSVSQFLASCKDKKISFNSQTQEGIKFMFLSEGRPSVLSLVCFAVSEGVALRMCLDALSFLVETGGEFNKFDKGARYGQSDGLYMLDVLWRLRQLKGK